MDKHEGMGINLIKSTVHETLTKYLTDGWVIVTGDPGVIIAVENEFYSGEKNNDFEIIFGNSKDKRFVSITLAKLKHLPLSIERPETIRGVTLSMVDGFLKVETTECKDEYVSKLIDNVCSNLNIE